MAVRYWKTIWNLSVNEQLNKMFFSSNMKCHTSKWNKYILYASLTTNVNVTTTHLKCKTLSRCLLLFTKKTVISMNNALSLLLTHISIIDHIQINLKAVFSVLIISLFLYNFTTHTHTHTYIILLVFTVLVIHINKTILYIFIWPIFYTFLWPLSILIFRAVINFFFILCVIVHCVNTKMSNWDSSFFSFCFTRMNMSTLWPLTSLRCLHTIRLMPQNRIFRK